MIEMRWVILCPAATVVRSPSGGLGKSILSPHKPAICRVYGPQPVREWQILPCDIHHSGKSREASLLFIASAVLVRACRVNLPIHQKLLPQRRSILLDTVVGDQQPYYTFAYTGLKYVERND